MAKPSSFARLLLATALVILAADRRCAFAAAADEPPLHEAEMAAAEPPEPSPLPDLVVEPQVVKGVDGEAKAAPDAVIVLPAVRAALSRATTGLREQALRGPAGGVGIDLQGRFLSAVVATTSGNGRLTTSCTADALAPFPLAPADTMTTPAEHQP